MDTTFTPGGCALRKLSTVLPSDSDSAASSASPGIIYLKIKKRCMVVVVKKVGVFFSLDTSMKMCYNAL